MNKKTQKNLIIQMIILIVMGIVLVSTVFGWFATGKKEHIVIFTTKNLEVEATLYQANDIDFDGVFLDTDYEEKTSAILLENVVSNQIYSFKLVVKNVGTLPGKLTINLKDILFLDDASNPNATFNQAFELKYSNLDGTTYPHHELSFPTSDYEIASLDVLNSNEEVVLLFQIIVGKKLTNAHYGYQFSISTIEVKLEQIP